MLLYYITDRSQFTGDETARRSRLLRTVAEAARCGVDYIQLREKNLSTRDLEIVARAAVQQMRTENQKPRTDFLINSRADVAIASGAGGVHLRSDDVSPFEVKKIWAQCGAPTFVTVCKSCHTRAEVARAAREGADFVVFGPVFEKQGNRPAGLEALQDACQEKIPVLALGGITLENAKSCIQAGAAGVAGVRLFQEHEMGGIVSALHRLESPVVSPQPSAIPKLDG